MVQGSLIIPNRIRSHCCPFPQGLGLHWGIHPPTRTYFFNFSQSCSLRAFTGTHPVFRGMAHRPSVWCSLWAHAGCREPPARGFCACASGFLASNPHPGCTPRACSFANQRFLRCIWGCNSTLREFVSGYGGCLMKKRQQATQAPSKKDKNLKHTVSTACRPRVFQIALFKGFPNIPHIPPPYGTHSGRK